MSLGELVAWAWEETPPVHRSAVNLLIHIVAVPMFVIGHVLLLGGLLEARYAAAGLVCIVASVLLQGIGHRIEPRPVHPFEGPKDFVRRFYVEQFCNFWRYLFPGGWYSSLKASLR